MGRLKLAVVGETPYAGRLAECIRKNAPEYLDVSSCGQTREMPGFLAQLAPDILLYETGTAVPEKLAGHTVKILLADGENSDRETGPAIFRYQQGAEILRQVFQIYEKISKTDLVCWCRTTDLEMAAVYAPGGHEFQLPFSMAYAALSGEKGKALYLNLSEFSGMNLLFGEEEGENFSDLIYGIRQNKAKFQLCLQSVLHRAEGVDYVLPPGSPQDLYEIQEEDLAVLLSLLREQTEYGLAVWNFGTLNHVSIQVMEHCSRIFCLVKENTFGKYRKADFEQFLEKEAGEKLRKQVQYVSLQAGIGGFMPGADVFTQLKSGEFGRQVRRIVQESSE